MREKTSSLETKCAIPQDKPRVPKALRAMKARREARARRLSPTSHSLFPSSGKKGRSDNHDTESGFLPCGMFGLL